MKKELVTPLKEVSKTTQNYLKITSIIMENIGLTPDILLSELKRSDKPRNSKITT